MRGFKIKDRTNVYCGWFRKENGELNSNGIEIHTIYYRDYDQYYKMPAACKSNTIEREYNSYWQFKKKYEELQIGRWHR